MLSISTRILANRLVLKILNKIINIIKQLLILDNNTKDLVINKKSILKSKPNATLEEKCHDRQHIIRFTGDEANDVIYQLLSTWLLI